MHPVFKNNFRHVPKKYQKNCKKCLGIDLDIIYVHEVISWKIDFLCGLNKKTLSPEIFLSFFIYTAHKKHWNLSKRLCEHIKCEVVSAKFYFNFIWYFKHCFLNTGCICTRVPKWISATYPRAPLKMWICNSKKKEECPRKIK